MPTSHERHSARRGSSGQRLELPVSTQTEQHLPSWLPSFFTKRLADGEGDMGEGRRGSTLPTAPAPKLSLFPSYFLSQQLLPNKTMYLNFSDL